jgi:hypothetical protein
LVATAVGRSGSEERGRNELRLYKGEEGSASNAAVEKKEAQATPQGKRRMAT